VKDNDRRVLIVLILFLERTGQKTRFFTATFQLDKIPPQQPDLRPKHHYPTIKIEEN